MLFVGQSDGARARKNIFMPKIFLLKIFLPKIFTPKIFLPELLSPKPFSLETFLSKIFPNNLLLGVGCWLIIYCWVLNCARYASISIKHKTV